MCISAVLLSILIKNPLSSQLSFCSINYIRIFQIKNLERSTTTRIILWLFCIVIYINIHISFFLFFFFFFFFFFCLHMFPLLTTSSSFSIRRFNDDLKEIAFAFRTKGNKVVRTNIKNIMKKNSFVNFLFNFIKIVEDT